MLKSSASNFTRYPLLWLSVCFTVGILSANIFPLDWKIYLAGCLVNLIFSTVFIKQNFVLMFIFTAFVAVGGLFFQIENQNIGESRLRRIYDANRIKSGDPIEIEGALESKPELAADGFFLILKVEKAFYKNVKIGVSGKVRLFAAARNEQIKKEYDDLNLQYDSRIRVACNLRREDDFLNAGVVSRTKLLDQQEIDATGIIKSPLIIEKIADENSFSPLAWIYERRQNLIIQISDKFNRSTAGVLIASLLGDGYFLDKQTAEVFRAGGTFHVLVISGLHITFIGGLTLLFIRFFTGRRLWQFLIASSLLWAYSLAVGANVPVVRATIMFTILLFSQVIYRSGTLFNALGFCALILLVWRPNDIFTSSFQLTFASVGAIVAMGFPLIEKLRAIGSWSPSSDEPFPPRVPEWLKRFCEMIYWREEVWKREVLRHLWTANIFKTPYLKWLASRNLQSVAGYLFEAIIVSIIVQAWLLPFLIIYFHRISVLSIFLNLWVGVIIALESFTAIFAAISANISDALAFPMIKITEFFNWLLVSVPNFFTDNSWATFRLPHYAGSLKAIYILYFAPLIFLAFALNKWQPFALNSAFQIRKSRIFAPPILYFAALIFSMFFAVIVFHPLSAPTGDGRLHIDFLDVGQGDSALIRFPNGETLLVDGGGKMNFNRSFVENKDDDAPEIFEPDSQTVGERVVSNFLWERGYSKIDYILATHADADHIQGLSDVAKNFTVKAAMFGRTPFKNAEYVQLYSILEKRGIKSLKLSRGDVLTFDDAKIEVLFPEKDENTEAVSDNNHSVVLRVTFGARKFLLTGDIEKETEKELSTTPDFLQTDLIKVAHHGSRTSSTENFINLSKAKLAIISVGRDSPFGHPHEDVINRWKNSGAMVLTTGENGTISVSTDGKDLQFKTFNKIKITR